MASFIDAAPKTFNGGYLGAFSAPVIAMLDFWKFNYSNSH